MILKYKKSSLHCNKSRQQGFTLIELLIVMTIISILATIVVPNYQRNLIRAREAVLMEDLYQMRRAIDAYFADHISYPESLDDLVANFKPTRNWLAHSVNEKHNVMLFSSGLGNGLYPSYFAIDEAGESDD